MNEPHAVRKCTCTRTRLCVQSRTRSIKPRIFISLTIYTGRYKRRRARTVTRAIFQVVTQIITGCSCSRSGKHLVSVVNLPGNQTAAALILLIAPGISGACTPYAAANVFTLLLLHLPRCYMPREFSSFQPTVWLERTIESFIAQGTRVVKEQKKL